MTAADPLTPFVHQLQWMVVTRLVPVILLAAIVGVTLRCTVERLTRGAVRRWQDWRQSDAPVQASPPCPVCDRTMVQRTARRGTSAGRSFWGCPGHPSCRGTRPAD